MYCTNCGTQIGDSDKYCRECACETKVGREAHRQSASGYSAPRRLYRVTSEKRIAGVCSGLARYFEVDVTLVRLLVVAGTLCSGGLGLLAYIAAWIVMPRENEVAPSRSTAGASTQTAA
jgi:phage shock protein PspC (stress-responsive transcriptional regulator)